MLGGVDYKLIYQWYAIRIGESRLSFIFQAQMVQQLYNLRPKSRSFEGVHEFWYHTLIVHLNSNLLVKTEIEKHPQGNLQQKSVIARYEPVQFLDNSKLFHLVLIFSENGQLLQEVEDDEEEVGVVSLEHGHQKGNDLPILHFALNLEVF